MGACIYEDLTLPLRAVRDLMRRDVEKVKVDSRETCDRLQRVRRASTCRCWPNASNTMPASGRSSICTASKTKSSVPWKRKCR